MMKFMLGAAAALAVAAPAHAATTGYVGAAYGHTTSDPGSDDNAWAIEGSATFNNLSGNLGVGVDAAVQDSDHSDTTTAGTVHVFGNTSQYLVGGFAGITHIASTDVWDAAGEGQLFHDNTPLGLAVTYVNDDDFNTHGWGANANAKFFVNDNFALGGNAGWFSLDAGSSNADAWVAGLAGEYQLSTVPVSFTAGYEHYDSNDVNLKVDTFTLGVRYNFHGTLKDRNRAGGDLAGLSGVSSLHF